MGTPNKATDKTELATLDSCRNTRDSKKSVLNTCSILSEWDEADGGRGRGRETDRKRAVSVTVLKHDLPSTARED